jgi:4-oxalocrotonate tautomerase
VPDRAKRSVHALDLVLALEQAGRASKGGQFHSLMAIVRAGGAPRNVRGSMSGGVPDVRSDGPAEYVSHSSPPPKESSMALIQVKVVAGVFTPQQKREIVERLTDAMIDIEGEHMRGRVWCLVEEVISGDWGVGGQSLTADDVKALQRG